MSRSLVILSALLGALLTGCYDVAVDFDSRGDDDDSAVADDDDTASVDSDGDGWNLSEDCDDLNAAVHPGAVELCNDLDDDCDGLIDDGASEAWFEDQDADGYGSDSSLVESCDPAPGFIAVSGDCDDSNPAIYPGSPGQADGIDSDCDGVRDWLVTIYTGVDDVGELCIDTWDSLIGETGGWSTGVVNEVWLDSGLHTVGIKGWDTGRVITAAIAHVEISTGQQWVSDDTWRYDPNPTASEENRLGWCAPHFDDSAWDLVRDWGAIGTSPWNGHAPSVFPTNSPAHWIWDHFAVDLNTQYLRKEFVLP